jgi:hypothetical protein
MSMPELQVPPHKSDHLKNFLTTFDLAASLKFAFIESCPQEGEEAGALDEQAFLKFFITHSKWTKHLVLSPASEVNNKYRNDTISCMSILIEDKMVQMRELGMKIVQGKLAALSTLISKLVKVAGGRDDGQSWKKELAETVELHEESTQEALKVLSQAYIDAIGSRTQPVLKVFSVYIARASSACTWGSLYWGGEGGGRGKGGGGEFRKKILDLSRSGRLRAIGKPSNKEGGPPPFEGFPGCPELP